MKNWVLSIGAGPEQVASILIAKELGLKVIAVDKDSHAPGFEIADAAFPIDIKDKEAVLNKAKEFNVSLVTPTPLGRLLITQGYVNDQLNLIGPSEESCEKSTDKLVFNEILRNNKINAPKQLKFNKLSEIADFKLLFPLVIKPIFGSGSRGVFKVSDIDELTTLYKEHISEYQGGFLLQDFVEGVVLGIDGRVINNTLELVGIREKEMTSEPYRVETSYLIPAEISAQCVDAMYQQFKKIVSILNLKNCIFHSDVIIDKNEVPHIIEFAPRPAGLIISSKLLPIATGKNHIREFIEYALNLTSNSKTEQKNNKKVLLQYLVWKEGEMIKIPDFKKFQEIEGLLEFQVGNVSGPFKTPKNISELIPNGYAIFSANSKAELLTLRNKFLDLFKI